MLFRQNPGMIREELMTSGFKRIGLILLSVFAFTFPLAAQLKIERTEPAANSTNNVAPTQIQVWFTGSQVVKLAKMNLNGPTGVVKLAAPVIDGNSISAAVIGTLGDGTYI